MATALVTGGGSQRPQDLPKPPLIATLPSKIFQVCEARPYVPIFVRVMQTLATQLRLEVPRAVGGTECLGLPHSAPSSALVQALGGTSAEETYSTAPFQKLSLVLPRTKQLGRKPLNWSHTEQHCGPCSESMLFCVTCEWLDGWRNRTKPDDMDEDK